MNFKECIKYFLGGGTGCEKLATQKKWRQDGLLKHSHSVIGWLPTQNLERHTETFKYHNFQL